MITNPGIFVPTPTLYKKTSTGKTQVWSQELDGNRYRSISGQLDGKKVVGAWTVCTGKNIGKANETSPEQQAALEVAANYKKKLAQGSYHANLDDIDTAKFFKPMLAQPYEKYPVVEGETVWVQPKLDGVRCIATREGLFTRQGKPIPGAPHVHDALHGWFNVHPASILDGELYADKFANDFNEIISLVRKQSNDPARRLKSREHIQYHVYDDGFHPGTFPQRIASLDEQFRAWFPDGPILLVQTVKVDTLDELDIWNARFVELGYEGMIVRRDAPYENKRSKSLLKRKTFLDEEFTVVSVNEGQGNRTGMAGFITYELGDGRTFKSGIKGSHLYATQLLADADKYVGGTGTVRFFERTPDGVPRFPVTVTLYEGERDL